MSSKGTVSIVGSEVMPLDYGSIDSESSPSLSSSEKTVEGVRGDEVVEGQGNEVVEIVEEVKQYRSELRTKDSLGHLMENYKISSRVLVRPAEVEERACSAPRDHWMPVYSHYLIAGLRFPIPELLVGLLLDYNIGLTQLVPNAMRGGSMRDKGWYYFTPRVASKESRSLFTTGPSSIKGWKEKFFFVDDTEWERGDAEDKEEEVRKLVRKLVRKGGDLLNILDLTSAQCIEVAELYGPSALSEAEMDQFLNTAGGVAIPKKPRKKSKTSTKQVEEVRARKEVVPATSAETREEVPQLKRKGWEERMALQKKKKVVVEEEERGNEVPQFIPQPPPVKLDPELRQLEEGAEVRAPSKGKGPVPLMAFQSSLFEAKNMTGARWFINSTFPKVDKCNARDEALRYCGASVVKHVLESASWVNGLAQEFMDSQKRASLSTKLVFEESKRRISESEREAQAQEIKLMKEAFLKLKENVQTLVHNGMKEHISNFISSNSFDNIVNLYRLPTAIIAFTNCRKKVKAEYPKVDITKITFGEQEEGVEEDMEEEGAEVEEDEVEAGVEGAEVDDSQPVPEVEIHSIPSDDEQPPLPDE
ncbi:hypothetical protein SLEP1_g28680 [Rubroshorea leprosula]|uniref:Uncharacterized protein n=1 Tax=Rubroshorea leprosula TaxID=152421 RepID=A0AAV5K1J8_9ROSI|nr:hypothetical protein SLEP1_g28680 [Rubroshorea leprosula]